MNELERYTRTERKEIEKLNQLVAAVGIRHGIQCPNWVVDQNKIIALLNSIPAASGGTRYPTGPTNFKAPRNGYCDPSLSESIRKFQQINGLGADGVVDPGGPTYVLLQKLAAGGYAQVGTDAARKQHEFITKTQTLINGLTPLLDRHSNIIGSKVGEIRHIKFDLERLVAQSQVTPGQEPLPVRNAVGVGVLVLIGVLLALAAAILAISLIPGWRKAAGIMADGIVEGISIRIRRLEQILLEAPIEIIEVVTQGLVDINDKAHEIQKRTKSCKPNFDEFERRTTELVFNLTVKKPTRFHKPIDRIVEEWLQALLDLIACFGPEGAALLKLLQKGWEGGMTLIDLIVKLAGSNLRLPLIPRN